MNNTNIFTIQLHDSQEDKSACSVTSAEWQHLRENSYSTLTELKKVKLSVFKEKLNLYNEKCRIKDDTFNCKAKLEADLRNSAEKIKKQNDRLLQYSIKELQESLSEEDSNEIKELTLPRVGALKVLAQNCHSGPGWIVIQRRTDNTVDFNQGWFSYVDGFGDMDGDFWFGLDNIHAMTKRQQHELYVHLVFPNNETRYAHYDNFSISGKNDDYKLKSLGNYFGNAGDGLRTHEHNIFKTVRYDVKNVTEYNRWWHHEYPTCNLNGVFGHKSEFGVWWCRRKGAYIYVEAVQMLIRPKPT
ncbi:hypothetical protein ACLKA7_014763 [Drosophila subpalustris]